MVIQNFYKVYNLLYKMGIKPKDILGMSGDVVKMGKSLFNTRVNPKLLKFIEKNQKIPTKILEQIKMHARTLKNASENQKKLFEVNIRDILNAKTIIKPKQFDKNFIRMPKKQYDEIILGKPPVTSVQKPVTSVREQAAKAFKGWKPTVIKGGKDNLATGGIAAHFRRR
jgi:hypothetical protein